MRSLLFLSLLAPLLAVADEPALNAVEMRVQEFSFEGMRPAMSLERFLEQHPKAKSLAANSNKKLGLKCYSVPVPRARAAYAYFVDDKLMEIRIVAGPEVAKANTEREYTITASKMEHDFGPAHEPKIDQKTFLLTMDWDFKKVGRRIYYTSDRKETLLQVVDSKLADELETRRKAKK